MREEELFNDIINVLQQEDGIRAKIIAKKLGVERHDINHILYSDDYCANFVKDENYGWYLSSGIVESPTEPDHGFYFLTDIKKLPEITIYEGKVDFADKLENVNVALLSMKQVAYVCGELQRHKETGDYYVEVHKWKSMQQDHNGFVLKVLYYDKEDKVRRRNFVGRLADYSTLRLLGYHVGGNLQKNERQRILMNIIFFGLMSKDQILSHIDYLRKTAHTLNSRKLWHEDYDFVTHYNENVKLPMFNFLNIRKRKWEEEKEQLKKDFFNELGIK